MKRELEKSTKSIDNSQDVIDSRDVIERIDYLAYLDDEPEAERDEDDWKELTALRALAEEASSYAPDWTYYSLRGEALIRDSYFTEYAEKLVKDIGDLPKEIPHYIEIDWEKTAANIQVDYTYVEFDGVTYWIR